VNLVQPKSRGHVTGNANIIPKRRHTKALLDNTKPYKGRLLKPDTRVTR